MDSTKQANLAAVAARLVPMAKSSDTSHVSSESTLKLHKLRPEYIEMLDRAKKYAAEQTYKFAMHKQAVIQPERNAKMVQRHQALLLTCRVYVGNISFEVTKDMIDAAFSLFGTIKSINMSWDETAQKHKGFAFVEYELPEAAKLSIDIMNGIQLGGRQLKVGRPSNMPQATPILNEMSEENKDRHRIYVSSLHSEMTEDDVKCFFESFGFVKSSKLMNEPNSVPGKHRGCGFVEFETDEAANDAAVINNIDLGPIIFRVCKATTPPEHLTNFGTIV